MANISLQFHVWRSTTQRHTVRPLINGGKDQQESHYRGEIIQRGRYRKTIIWRQIHHIFFTMDYMYIFKFLSKTNVFLEKAYTSETWSALDNSEKLMSAYALYKIDFLNDIWVVQILFFFFFFRFKLVDYFHKQFVWKRLTPILFTVLHNLTKAVTLRIKKCVLKNKQITVHLYSRSYLVYTDTCWICLCLLWSPCSQTSNRLYVCVCACVWRLITDKVYLFLKIWPAEIMLNVNLLYANIAYTGKKTEK